jgi:hypothetical protein
VVKYQATLATAVNLLLVGQNAPDNHLIGAFDATSGAPLPSYPTVTDDYQFLSSSDVAKVVAGTANQIVAGTGLGLLHAYDGASGQDASGFPKQTGGWLFAPAAISDDGRIADITREGYLFEWNVGQTPCQPTGTEWPGFRHDPHDSGNYNHDGTPPAAPANVTLTALGGNRYSLRLIAPGDDGFCGTADHFVARVDGQDVALGLGSPPAGGAAVTANVTLPAGASQLLLQAVDRAANVGAPALLTVPAPAGGGAGTGGSGATGDTGATSTGGGQVTGLPPGTGPAGGAVPAPHPGAGGGVAGNTATFLGLPAARRCVSRRRFTIHLRAPHAASLTSARVYVNRRPVRVLAGRRLHAPVDLRGLPRGRFTVTIIARTGRGAILRSSRGYHTCTPRHSASRR